MNSSIKLDVDLIKKYDVLAPRYTSYPTAPQFHSGFNADDYRDHAHRSNASLLPKDLSIYLHIPFCHSLCYFCGCNKVVTQTTNKKVSDYLERLMREISLRSRLFNDDRLVTQIHFGGGTPNFLSLEQIADLLDQIALQFHLDLPSNLEIGIELDPRSINPDEVRDLARLGFTRFSIGVQDFSNDVQEAVNRVQNRESTLAVIEAAMASTASVNVDLITGLPKQTVESFEATLDTVIETGVTRVAAYNFAYLPERIKAQRLIDASTLPAAPQRIELAQKAKERLLGAGYQHIGMDHYALPSDPLAIAQTNDTLQRNFQGYSTHRDTDLIGIGASAISKLDTAFAQNSPELSLYNEQLDADILPICKGLALTEDDRIRAEVIQQIMCRSQVNLSQPIGRFIDRDSKLSLAEYFESEIKNLDQFQQDGLINLRDDGFDLTEQGRYFMRPIAAIFDRYLDPDQTKQGNRVVTFSRTV